MKGPEIITTLLLLIICLIICLVDPVPRKDKSNSTITLESTDILGTVSQCYITNDGTDALGQELNSFHMQFITSDGEIYIFNIPEELFESLTQEEYTVINYTQYCENGIVFNSNYYMGMYEIIPE